MKKHISHLTNAIRSISIYRPLMVFVGIIVFLKLSEKAFELTNSILVCIVIGASMVSAFRWALKYQHNALQKE